MASSRPHYLYRAVDKHGKSVDSLLCVDVSLDQARLRHQAARRWLAAGIDPALQKQQLRCALPLACAACLVRNILF